MGTGGPPAHHGYVLRCPSPGRWDRFRLCTVLVDQAGAAVDLSRAPRSAVRLAAPAPRHRPPPRASGTRRLSTGVWVGGASGEPLPWGNMRRPLPVRGCAPDRAREGETVRDERPRGPG